jgi:hypothetical protein
MKKIIEIKGLTYSEWVDFDNIIEKANVQQLFFMARLLDRTLLERGGAV